MNKKQIQAVLSAFGRMGGSVKSEAKAATSRANGALGGRPRKNKKTPAAATA